MTLEDLSYELIEKDGKYYYNGNLYLYRLKIASLPDNLTVGGYLDLRKTNITSLPDNLRVSGFLDTGGTKIASLPDNLIVGGSLSIRGTNITSLPDNLIVGGYLDVRDTKITSLPNNLRVGGCLDLSKTNITSLPDNLIVGGFLNVRGTKINSLPDNLIVGEDIYYDWNLIAAEEVSKVNHSILKVLFWRDKEYVKVINGEFFKILSNKGSIYQISELGNDRIYSLITNENGSKYIIEDNLETAKKNYNLLNIKR